MRGGDLGRGELQAASWDVVRRDRLGGLLRDYERQDSRIRYARVDLRSPHESWLLAGIPYPLMGSSVWSRYNCRSGTRITYPARDSREGRGGQPGD